MKLWGWPLLLVLLALLAGCRRGGEQDEAWVIPSRVDEAGRVVLTAQQSSALGLELVEVSFGKLPVSVIRYGKLVARPEEDLWVAAPVAGRLGMPRVALGDRVPAGALIVELEPPLDTASAASFELRARELEGEAASSVARLVALKSEAERLMSLVDLRLATQAEFDRAVAEVSAEEAHIAALGKTRAELERGAPAALQLVAPHAGTVVELTAAPGQLVAQGAPVARLLKPGPRWFDLAVPAAEAPGDSYEVRGASAAVPATLLHRGQLADADGVRRDRLVVPGADAAGLLVGARLAVAVVHDVAGLLLPAACVVRRGTQSLVFVATEPGCFAPRQVELLGTSAGRVALSGDLAAGESVVAVGAAALLNELELGAPNP